MARREPGSGTTVRPSSRAMEIASDVSATWPAETDATPAETDATPAGAADAAPVEAETTSALSATTTADFSMSAAVALSMWT